MNTNTPNSTNNTRFIWFTTTALFAIMGALSGGALGTFYIALLKKQGGSPLNRALAAAVIGTITVGFIIVFARFGSWLANRHLIPSVRRMHQMSAADRILGVVGALLGLLFGALVTLPLLNLSHKFLMVPLQLCVMAITASIGVGLLQGMRAEMLRVLPQLDEAQRDTAGVSNVPKFLDTNVIIDGRMVDLCKTGFVEGPIYVPHFVIEEVQYIADSSDSMRRARGRRGLDVLNAMRELMVMPPSNGRSANPTQPPQPVPLVHILNDIPASVQKIDTVDSKLVFLAKELGGSIVTNDFNLNRVAELQGVKVLNINELSQALKPVVLPGEEMTLTIVKEGKEAGQGVGYLEDGTMVVVGDGQAHIGETCKVTISSVYQTLAGKMIFAELKGMKGSGDDLFNGAQGSTAGKKHEGDDFSTRSGGGVRRKGRA